MESRRDMAGICPGRTWVGAVVSLFLGLWLTACGGGGGGNGVDRKADDPLVVISGQVVLEDQSMDGATISLSRIDVARTPVTENVKGKQILVELPEGKPVVGPQGDVQFQVRAGALQDDQLYSVTVTCQPVSEHCAMQMPLHVVLSGARLQQGRWSLNVPTEVAYQRLAYYVAARFSEVDLKQEMDITARQLLKADVDKSGTIDYEDLLQWRGVADEGALLHSSQMDEVIGLLTNSNDVNALQVAVQQLASPFLARIQLQGEDVLRASRVRLGGHYAYVQPFSGGVEIFDVTDPAQPVHVGMLTDTRIKDFVLQDERAYVVHNNKLDIIDISDPHNPTEEDGVRFPEYTYDTVRVDGDHAFVCGKDGVRIVDVGANKDAVVVGAINGACKKLEVVNDILFLTLEVTPGFDEIKLFDVAAPEVPRLLSTIALRGEANTLCVRGRYLHLVENTKTDDPFLGESNLATFDLVVPESPAVLHRYPLPKTQIYLDMRAEGNFLYLLGSVITVVDLSLPGNPRMVSTTDIGRDQTRIVGIPFYDEITNMSVADGIAYVAWDKALEIYNISSAEVPLSGGFRTEYVAQKMVVDDARLYYTTSDGYLYSRNRYGPNEFGSATIVGKERMIAWLLWDIGNYLYWTGFTSTIEQIRSLKVVDKRSQNLQESVVETAFVEPYLNDLESYGALTYIAGLSGLVIADFSQPIAPMPVSSLNIGETVYDVELADGYAFLRLAERLQVVDVRNASNLLLKSGVPALRDVFPIGTFKLFQKHAYLIDTSGSLAVLDVGDVDNIKVVKSIDVGAKISQVNIYGHYVYLSTLENIIQVLDVSNPAAPVLTGGFRTKGLATSIATDGTYLFVSTHYGIEILPLLHPN